LTISFSALISACEKDKQFERALMLLNTMQLHGLVANTIIDNVLASALTISESLSEP